MDDTQRSLLKTVLFTEARFIDTQHGTDETALCEISLHALVQAGALAQRCGKRRVTQTARVGSPGAPALLTELQNAGLGERAVGLTPRRTRLRLVTRHAAAVLGPGHGDTVGVKAPSHTHHTDITFRERRTGWSEKKQGRRRRWTSDL